MAGFLVLRLKSQARRIGAALAFFLLGLFLYDPTEAFDIPSGHVAGLVDGSQARVTGIVSGPLENRPECLRFVLKAESVSRGRRLLRASGNVRVSAYDVRPAVKSGDRVSFVTRLRRIQSFKNPGSFDYAAHMADRDILVSATLGKKSRPVIFAGASGNGGFFPALRRDIADNVGRAAPGKGGDVLSALVTGDVSRISADLRQSFADSGTAHILSVSGLHVGLAAGFAFFVLNGLLGFFPSLVLTGKARRTALVLAVIPAILYGFLTGMSPATLRAVIMVGVLFLSFSVKRQSEAINSLAAAALAILIISPGSLFQISFQLSFLSVFFILVGFRSVPFLRHRPRESELFRLWLYRVASLFAITVFATLATLPIVLRAFQQVSVSGFAANFFLVPLVGTAVLPLGLTGGAILPVSPGIASWLFSLAGFFMEWGVAAIRWFANFEFSAVMPVYPSVFESVLYYLIIFCLLKFRQSPYQPVEKLKFDRLMKNDEPQGVRKANESSVLKVRDGIGFDAQHSGSRFSTACYAKAGLLLVAAMIAGDAYYWYQARFLDDTLRVTVLDVGQGTSVVVRFPKGPVMLADAGGLTGESSLDIGKAVVAPYLWSQKIHTVDVAVLTHPDQDHAGGMPFILEHFGVRKFWSNGQETESGTYEKIMSIVGGKGIARKTHQELSCGTVINGVSIKSLYPPPEFTPPPNKRTNQFSLVLRLKMGEKTILITGDVTKPGLRKMMKAIDPKELDCTVLVVPHHGAKSSFLQEFADAARPRWAVVSVGRNNPWKLPREDVLAAYRRAGAEILRTDINGAAFIETDGETTDVSSFVD